MTLAMAARTRGFTLIELLIAMAVFAVMGALAYGGLNSVLTTQQHVEQVAKRLADLQLSIRFLERDLSQLSNRPIRNRFGDQESALMAGNRPLLVFTRAGLPNPAAQTRSQLQRVAYDLDEKALVRLTWPALDGADPETVTVTPLLDEVSEMEIRVLDGEGEWHTSWPPLATGSTTVSLPRAVEVLMDAPPWGRVRRLIALPD
jgi:general secretion pathway protein J